ncbi:transcription termination factor nusG family protein, partial [Bacteroides fragilis str. S6L5]
MNNSINKSWYALRITYSRELAFKEYLDSRGVRNFLPMRYEYVFRGERKIRKLVPVVHNLVFVYATRSEVDEIKSTVGASLPIRYIMDRETRQPITIPEVQMRSFIAVAGNYDEQVVYLDPSVVSMKKGDRVRVTGGIFEGVEG